MVNAIPALTTDAQAAASLKLTSVTVVLLDSLLQVEEPVSTHAHNNSV